MKWKHVLLALLPILSASACSDDDEPADVCQDACATLSLCSMEVPCDGNELPTGACTSACQRRQAHGAAQCVLGVGSCDIMRMNACRVQMPCN